MAKKPAAPAPKPGNQRPTETPMPRGADPAGQGATLERDQIARKAYEKYLQHGEHGRDQEDWLAAEQELRRGGK